MPAPDPRVPGRYAATVAGDCIHFWCQDHPDEPVLTLSAAVDDLSNALRTQEAIRAHDLEQHKEDPVV